MSTGRFSAHLCLVLFLVLAFSLPGPARPDAPVRLNYSRAELETRWEARIRSMLARGVVPLIDMESTLRPKEGRLFLDRIPDLMDRYGVALISFDTNQRPKDGSEGYRWSTYIEEIVNAHPDRFIPTANAGTNPNWVRRKGGQPWHFIDQMEARIRNGDYASMGELEFRHYMSAHQCKAGRYDRDVDIPLNGKNGHRLFRLSEETGVPFVIHLEPEDHALEALEEMLGTYPGAKVIVAHFGQIRHPLKEKRFGPELVRHLLGTYPNLYYDLSVGHPGRRYPCTGERGDTVIWQGTGGNQRDVLREDYKAILTDFSDRFVCGLDYGGGRWPFPEFIEYRVGNLRRILRDLPETAKHDIGYRNAWKLLTGRDWN